MLGGIEVIEVGERITLDDGHTVRLKKKIGDGFTATIFIGEAEDKSWRSEDMVLKIAKLHANGYVSDEYTTLITLSNNILENGQPITPRVFGKALYGEHKRFVIAMELIKGSPILGRDELLKREEKDVLKIYREVYLFMSKLHKMGITYPDLKLDNFFWDDSDPTARIRVLDFGAMGTTSDPANDTQCHREIFRVALGMFVSLTGRHLDVGASDQTRENVPDALNRHQISTGTKQLMSRLLSKQREFRITEALKVVDEIEVLRKFWEFSQEELFRVFESNLTRGESLTIGEQVNSKEVFRDKRACAERAAFSIDIYHLRFGKSQAVSDEIHGKLEDLQLATSYINEAKRAYLTGDSNRALEKLKEGEALSEKPGIFLMWQYMFEDAYLLTEDQFIRLYSATEDFLDSYYSGNLHAARLLLNETKKDFPTYAPLTSISNYFSFIDALEQSDAARSGGNFQSAIDAFKVAQELFQSLPNKEYVQENYFRDFNNRLKILADESGKQFREGQRPKLAWQEASTALKAGEITKLIDHFRAAIQFGEVESDQQEILASAITDQLSNSKTKEARALAGLIEYLDSPIDKLIDLRRVTYQIEKIEHAIQLEDLPKVVALLSVLTNNEKYLRSLNPTLSFLLEKVAKMDLRSVTDQTIEELSSVANKTGNREVANQFSNFARTRAEEVKKRIEPALRQIELDLLPTQYWHLELDQFLDELTTRNYMAQLTRINEEKGLLDGTIRRIDFLKSIEILDRNQRELLGKFEAEAYRRRSILDEKSALLPEFKKSFDEHSMAAIERWKAVVQKYGIQGSETTRVDNGGSLEELVGEVFRIVKVMTESNRLFENDTVFSDVAGQVFLAYDLLGAPAWEKLLRVEGQMPGDVADTIEEVKALVSSGDINGASRKIQSLDALRQLYPDVQLLRIRVLKIISFSDQLKKFSNEINRGEYSEELLMLIVEADGLNLPKTFFDHHRLSMYVINLMRNKSSNLKSSLDKLKRSISNDQEPDPAARQLFSDYVLLKSALKVIEKKGANDGKGQ